MQVQKVNNQQSFTATAMYYQRVPQRLYQHVGTSVLMKGFEDAEADKLINRLIKRIKKRKPKHIKGEEFKLGRDTIAITTETDFTKIITVKHGKNAHTLISDAYGLNKAAFNELFGMLKGLIPKKQEVK